MASRAQEGIGVAEALQGTNTPVENPTNHPGDGREGEVGETFGGQAASSSEPMDPPTEMKEAGEPGGFNDGLENDQDGEEMEEDERSESSVSSGEGATSDGTPTEYSNTIDDPDWGEVYRTCPRFGEIWNHVTNPHLA